MKPLKAKVSITIDHNIVGELKDINMILKAYLNKLHQSSGQSSKNPPHAWIQSREVLQSKQFKKISASRFK